MPYSKRQLVYCTPKDSPDALLSSLDVNDANGIFFDKTLTDGVTAQLRFSTQLEHTGTGSTILDEGESLHITWKSTDISRSGYFDDWNDWMHKGLTIQYKNTTSSSLNSQQLIDQITSSATQSNPTVLENGWIWNKSDFNADKIQLLQQCLDSLLLPQLPDSDIDPMYQALEITLSSSNANIYLTYTDLNLPILLNNNHELAILTEMPVQTEDCDRFVQGSRFKLNRNTNKPEIFQTVLMHTPFTSNLNSTFTMSIDQSANAAIHPIVNYSIDHFDKWDIFPHDDAVTDTSECTLHLASTFSKDYIIDKYELERLINSKTNTDHCIQSINTISNPDIDLELPNYKINEWGTYMDLQLNKNCVIRNNGSFNVPVHLRYVEPNETGSNVNLQLPSSQLFWKCPVAEDTYSAITNSFYHDKTRLTFEDDDLLSRRYYYSASTVPETTKLSMVAGNTSLASTAENSTAVLVLLATVFLIYQTVQHGSWKLTGSRKPELGEGL